MPRLRALNIAVAIVVLLFGLIAVPRADAAQTALYLHGQVGSIIGNGINRKYNADDGTFTSDATESIVYVSFVTTDLADRWTMYFTSPKPDKLVRGVYEGAFEYLSISSLPTMEIKHNYYACKQDLDPKVPIGRFTVLEIARTSDGKLRKLAVDFEMHCLGRPEALYGAIRLNSDVTIEPRLAVGYAKALKGSEGLSDGAVAFSLSLPVNGPVSIGYATADDTAKQGVDYVGASGKLIFPPYTTTQILNVPIIGNRTKRGSRKFAVNITAAGRPIGFGQAKVKILDPNAPLTVFAFNSQPGDWVGKGRSWLSIAERRHIGVRRNQRNGISVFMGDTAGLALEMSGPYKQTLVAKTYLNAEHYYSGSPSAPGLYASAFNSGCSKLSGWFRVNSVEYADDASVRRLSGDFEQHCDNDDPALFGSVRVNAPLQQISVTNAVIKSGIAKFTVTLNPPSTKTVNVNFKTSDGTAYGGYDYVTTVRELSFAPGEIRKVVDVPIIAGAKAGRQFYGELSTTGAVSLWISKGRAKIM